MIILDITITQMALEYISKASETISNSKEKPALAIWADRVYT
ncbi:MAG: hypothetical protein QXR19_11805 [Candidatus Jordarchaeaceae archaeon]